MHNIEMFDFPENTSKEKIEKELNAHVKRETYYEGGHGLYNKIRWFDRVVGDRQAASDYLERIDNGDYDQIAVKYIEVDNNVGMTQKHKDLLMRRKVLFDEYSTESRVLYKDTVKSQFIGCKGCNSKLNSKYIRGNSCPLCGLDLRSTTTLTALKNKKEKIDEIDKKIREEEKKRVEKQKNKGNVRWLVKIEYHT